MAPRPSGPIVILENGAHTVKCGVLLTSSSCAEPRIIPNACVRPRSSSTLGSGSRWLIGHEISDALAHDALDYAGMQYRLPFEKGFLTDWDAQKAVWDGLFSVSSSSASGSSTRTGPLAANGIDTTSATLLVTEPYFNLPAMQDTYDQIVFEEYEFAACWRGVPAALVPHGNLFEEGSSTSPKPQCTLIVDAGFSYTHVVPIVDGRVVWQAVKRIDAGGKLLTNILKEQLSYRQWNMMAETFIVQEVKESCCFVAAADGGKRGVRKLLEGEGMDGLDFRECMERCRADPSPHTNPIVQEYVLPDLAAGRKGHVRTRTNGMDQSTERERDRGREEQVLVMGVERFSVPEVLFRPDDIGLNQSGLAPTIAHSLASLPAALQPFAGIFWAHVGLVGGCTKFPGFKERLEAELRALAPVGCVVKVWGGGAHTGDEVVPGRDDPITTAYHAARDFASTSSRSLSTSTYPTFAQQTLSRAEYLETGGGSAAARRRFGAADWQSAPEENWRGRVDEMLGDFGDDDDIHDLDGMGMDLDMFVGPGVGMGTDARWPGGARTRQVESINREEKEDMEDADTREAREKEERRKAARRKRDADRKKRVAEEAAAAASGDAAEREATAATVVSKGRGGARGKQKDSDGIATDAPAADGKVKGNAKAVTPAPPPTAPLRPRLRSTRAGAAVAVEEEAPTPTVRVEMGEVGSAGAGEDAQMGGV